jgi:hypothetical protein
MGVAMNLPANPPVPESVPSTFPGEALAIRVVNAFQDGIGACFRPWIVKRDAVAQAEARRIERLAQESLRQDIKDVRAGRRVIGKNYSLLNPPEASDLEKFSEIEQVKSEYIMSMAQAGYDPARLVELERRINLDQISSIAIDEALERNKEKISEEKIDPDWFARWREKAQDVSHEEMQRLWGKILVDEAQSHGAFSVHAIDLLSRMSREDAELIAKAGEFSINGRALFSGGIPIMEKTGLMFKDLIYLNELNVLTGVATGAALKFEIPFELRDEQKMTILRSNDIGAVLIPREGAGRGVVFPSYSFSRVGQQLLSLISPKGNPEYVSAFLNLFRATCDVYVGEIVQCEKHLYEVVNLRPFIGKI